MLPRHVTFSPQYSDVGLEDGDHDVVVESDVSNHHPDSRVEVIHGTNHLGQEGRREGEREGGNGEGGRERGRESNKLAAGDGLDSLNSKDTTLHYSPPLRSFKVDS